MELPSLCCCSVSQSALESVNSSSQALQILRTSFREDLVPLGQKLEDWLDVSNDPLLQSSSSSPDTEEDKAEEDAETTADSDEADEAAEGTAAAQKKKQKKKVKKKESTKRPKTKNSAIAGPVGKFAGLDVRQMIIRSDVSPELDELRDIVLNSQRWMKE